MSRDAALITGASAGIGLALAEAFAAGGHDLVLVARSADKLAAAAAALARRHDVRCEWIAADLQDPAAPAALLAAVAQRQMTITTLVNNAGVLWEGRFAETSLERHRGLLQVNILATTALTHLFLQPMLARRRGRVINIASTSAFNPIPSLACYAASKAYLLSFSEALALELRGSGVSVTAVCPGFTETAMIAQEGRRPMRLPLVPNLTPETVAREAYAAGMAGKAVHVNGWANRLTVEALRLPPRWLRRELIGALDRLGF